MTSSEEKKLVDYVAKARAKGDSEKKIHKSLINAGWPEKTVDKVVYGSSDESKGKTIIRCSNLTKRFGEHLVLDKISLEVKEGEVFGIIGLSGSGKTTLLNTLIGFLTPEEGEVFFRQPHNDQFVSVLEKPTDVKRLFGFATQEPSFYTKLTAEENLDHFGSLYNLQTTVRKTNVSLLLELMDLTESKNTLAENLSGGMQRRLGIACSLIHDPRILILDEPTADLDPFLRREMWDLIKKINQQGTTVILSSHFLSEMEELCSRISILHNRQIVDVGTPHELTQKFSRNDEITLELASHNYDKIVRDLDSLGLRQVSKKGRKLFVCTPEAEKILHHVLHIVERNKEKLVDLGVSRPNLGEVFETLVKGK
jgi:ABC-2 type transport system ATP-binding protein